MATPIRSPTVPSVTLTAPPATAVKRPHPRPATAHPRPAAPHWSLHRGLVLLGFASLVVSVLVHTGAEPSRLASPELVVVLPAVAAALLLVQRETPRRLLVGALAFALHPVVALLVGGAAGTLAEPLAGRGWASALLLVLTLVLALPAGLSGYRLLRNQATGGSAARGARPSLPAMRSGLATPMGMAAVVVVALALGALAAGALAADRGATLASQGQVVDFAPDATLEVRMERFAFVPAVLEVPAGQVVELVVTNQDLAYHTFSYATGGRTIHHDLEAGATTRFLLRLDEPGSLAYWCEPHLPGMAGTFDVQEPTRGEAR